MYNSEHRKEEEKTIIRLALLRFDDMKDSEKYSFEDGATVSEFINNIIEWYRYLKEENSGMTITYYGKKFIERYDEINKKYGFNFTIEYIQDNTIYTASSIS